jgi:hypothetical protein
VKRMLCQMLQGWVFVPLGGGLAFENIAILWGDGPKIG